LDVAEQSGRIRGALATAGVLVLVFDQFTKWLALDRLDPGRPIDVLWKLRWNLARNEGASFSMGDSFGPVIGVIVIMVVIGLLWMARSITTMWSALALGSVVGGAIGNLVDRVIYAEDGILSGAVVDFIDFQFWPVFNVADMGVVLGSIGLLALSWRSEATEPEMVKA